MTGEMTDKEAKEIRKELVNKGVQDVNELTKDELLMYKEFKKNGVDLITLDVPNI